MQWLQHDVPNFPLTHKRVRVIYLLIKSKLYLIFTTSGTDSRGVLRRSRDFAGKHRKMAKGGVFDDYRFSESMVTDHGCEKNRNEQARLSAQKQAF